MRVILNTFHHSFEYIFKRPRGMDTELHELTRQPKNEIINPININKHAEFHVNNLIHGVPTQTNKKERCDVKCDNSENMSIISAKKSDNGGKISKRKLKLLYRPSISDLKQKASRPDTVEIWDVSAPDPMTLIDLKSCRNSVPVPRHWSQKRKYLLGKRGIEKPRFELPCFIEATGISKLRKMYQINDEAEHQKQKGRDRVRPKMHKLEINYEIMRDAFFKYQTKAKMSRWGEVYFEGKEFEFSEQTNRPGTMSEKLMEALGMGTNGQIPPPWLINMQRHGLPPSYPDLKMPGLNAAIPIGCRFGYGPGEWGKPPSNLNIFHSSDITEKSFIKSDTETEVNVDKAFEWGRLEELEGHEVHEVSEDHVQEDKEVEAITCSTTDVTNSTPRGLETPKSLNIRKEGKISEMVAK